MPRKRHVSRNPDRVYNITSYIVMPRKRHVSRNRKPKQYMRTLRVMPRKRHVSRNALLINEGAEEDGHASQEACE